LQKSIKRLKLLKAMNEDGRMAELSKKKSAAGREMKHLFQNLEGIENMAQLPDAMFVIDFQRGRHRCERSPPHGRPGRLRRGH